MECDSCAIPSEGPKAASSFPIWKMEDGRIFTDFLHRSAYYDPVAGSYEAKEDMKSRGAEFREKFYKEAAESAQLNRCSPPEIPMYADAQTCTSRYCTFAPVPKSGHPQLGLKRVM